jgi:hypothetical protein
VVDLDLADAGAGAVGEHGDEAVHLAVEAQLVGDLAAVDLQRAAEIADGRPGDLADHVVRDLRGDLPQDHAVLAVLPPPGDEVVPVVEHLHHRGDVPRVVLHVGVHRDDDGRRHVAQARVERGGLAGVAAKEDALEVGPLGRELLQQLPRAIVARVVDGDDFERLAPLLHHLVDFVEEGLDVLDLVVDGENDADLGSRHGGLRSDAAGHRRDVLARRPRKVRGGLIPDFAASSNAPRLTAAGTRV